MPRKFARLSLAPLAGALLLAACGTPQQQCIARNTGEYRTVSELLAEVEGNLARGYAWEEREVSSVEWEDCPAVVRGPGGEPRAVLRPCLRRVTDTERFRVPIDPLSEARKRDGLIERQAALRPQAEAALRACRAAYPEA